MRVVLCVQGWWLVALAAPGQFPCDTVATTVAAEPQR